MNEHVVKVVVGTDQHSELVVGEQGGHEVEEVVVVFASEDSLDGDLHDFGFERWWEFALDFPIL